LKGFTECRFSLDEPTVASPRTLVFSNRLVNDFWKRSFATECSELSFVRAVSDDERQRIDAMLLNDSALRTAFAQYESAPKPVDLVVNLRFGELPGADSEGFKAICGRALDDPIRQGLTLDEVLGLIRAVGYEDCMNKNPTLVTLQLASPNYELRAGEFVMRSHRFLDY
jgi:hypothetical protein